MTFHNLFAYAWRCFKRTREYEILFTSDMEALRMMLALGSIYTGAQFALWPVPVFPTALQLIQGTGRHTYSLMAEIGPEWAWGWAMMAQGVLAYNSLRTRTYNKFRLWFDAALGSILWITAVACCYFAYFPSNYDVLAWRIPKIMGMEAIASGFMAVILIRYAATDRMKNGDRV